MRVYYMFSAAIFAAFSGTACSAKGPPPPKPPAEVPATHNSQNTVSTIPSSTSDSEDAKEDRLIARMLKKVSQVRELSAKAPVPGKVLDRQSLIAKVRAHVDKEVPKSAIVNEGLALQMLGFVPTKFDYE